MRAADATWEPGHPRQAPKLLSRVPVPWWIAGGWALELFAGGESRPHGDLDIGVLRRDARLVIGSLPGWEFVEAQGGELHPLHGRAPRAEVNGLWGRPLGASSWVIEVLLDDSDGESWVFRRHKEIRRPLADVIRYDGARIPYLAPEIQLLYKANRLKVEDDADFRHVVPRLDARARAWLHAALESIDPDHPWLDALFDVNGQGVRLV